MPEGSRASKRTNHGQWKNIYGTDRKYTRRVDAAKERGQYTEPGTPSNAKNVQIKAGGRKRTHPVAEIDQSTVDY